MEIDRLGDEFDHQGLTVFRDPETGVTGAIAVHSTALGPAMGGLRLSSYPTLADGLIDALRLARAMSFKNAAAGLDLGGGKAVLLDDGLWPTCREARMRAVGRAIEGLDGGYITAEDVGTTPDDMDVISAVTRHVAGRSTDRGGRGDPSPWTARTVLGAIESAVRLRIGADSLDGVRVGVQGVGGVGARLAGLLCANGARVFVSDLDTERTARVAETLGVTPLPLDGFVGGAFDVLAPCALGGVITTAEIPELQATVVAGAANNPLAGRELAATLREHGVLYVPDFLANCGGIIHVGAEVLDLDESQVERLVAEAIDRTDVLLKDAEAQDAVPMHLAEAFAEARLRQARDKVA
jgi:leucine dehydrogenase